MTLPQFKQMVSFKETPLIIFLTPETPIPSLVAMLVADKPLFLRVIISNFFSGVITSPFANPYGTNEMRVRTRWSLRHWSPSALGTSEKKKDGNNKKSPNKWGQRFNTSSFLTLINFCC